MKVWKYPKEIYEYVLKNARNMTDQEIADKLNARYKEYDFTKEKVREYRKNHKINTGRKPGTPKGKSLVYPAGLEDFIRENAAGTHLTPPPHSATQDRHCYSHFTGCFCCC